VLPASMGIKSLGEAILELLIVMISEDSVCLKSEDNSIDRTTKSERL
jgi:hypothetical protein